MLCDQEVCVVHGFGGVGKSTLAALLAYEIVEQLLVWWLPSESANALLLAFEELARAVGVDL